MKIVILDGFTENPGDLSWEGFEKLGSVTVYDRTAKEDIIARIGDAQIVVTNKVPLDAGTMEACPSIKYIGVLATGFNVVDTVTAKEKGIVVTNIPTYGTAAVAQFAMALLLEICHRVGHHNKTVHEGRWSSCPDFCYWDYPLIELAGKTIGIIGFGRIGQSVAKLAMAFGMPVLAYDAFPNKSLESDMCRYVDMETLLANSDVISLHAPLTPETQGLVNKKTISRMKDGVIILNNSRGPLIVEQDLREALLSGKVYAAGLDVVSSEPIKADNPLLGLDNCIITPHISWAPKESRQRLMDIAVNNLKSFLEGNPTNVVNG
ncbi:MAG TPA: glycerate dehydrogenase [Sphaerochaeta sp.]|jgi:glycerate dehydrogenase|nr:MAG: glycerate dehydrogenase [Spirochaetes bacterium GWC2_52_13]HCG64461.1 glycerate dehydrogenase [Sphaerochaeta sp.]HCS37870.1 glycerate dehydrogenase [Sphaerochaeta sp.]